MADAESPERRRTADAELTAAVHAAQRGDADAFRLVFRAVQPAMLRYLRVLVGDDAEDVASEAWVQIVRDLGRFRGDADGFRGWAATIGRYRAIDHLRLAGRRPVSGSVEALDDLPADVDTAGSALESVSTDAALALIAALPREQAEAVLLRVVMGLDAKTAARVLDKHPGAVRTAAHRGLRRLAASLPAPADGSRECVPDGLSGGTADRTSRSRPVRGVPPGDVAPSVPPTLRRLG